MISVLIKLFKSEKTFVVALPDDTSKKVQPIDESVFSAFKTSLCVALSLSTKELFKHGIIHEQKLAEIRSAIKYAYFASFLVQT